MEEQRPISDSPGTLENSPRPRRARFTLLTLLLAMGLMAAIVANLKNARDLNAAHRDLKAAGDEIKKLRSELGELTIADPKLVHVIALPTFEGFQWRWRVHLPKEKKYRIRWATNEIPGKGLPETSQQDSSTFQSLPAEPFILSVGVYRDPQGEWRLTWHQPSGNIALPLRPKNADWLETMTGFSSSIAGTGRTDSVVEGEPMVLVRVRKALQAPNGSVSVDPNPTDGLMVWLEEIAPPKPAAQQ